MAVTWMLTICYMMIFDGMLSLLFQVNVWIFDLPYNLHIFFFYRPLVLLVGNIDLAYLLASGCQLNVDVVAAWWWKLERIDVLYQTISLNGFGNYWYINNMYLVNILCCSTSLPLWL